MQLTPANNANKVALRASKCVDKLDKLGALIVPLSLGARIGSAAIADPWASSRQVADHLYLRCWLTSITYSHWRQLHLPIGFRSSLAVVLVNVGRVVVAAPMLVQVGIMLVGPGAFGAVADHGACIFGAFGQLVGDRTGEIESKETISVDEL